MNKKPEKKKKRSYLWLIFLIVIFAIALVGAGIYFKSEFDDIKNIKNEIKKQSAISDEDDIDTNFLKAIVPDSDTAHTILSDKSGDSIPEFAFDTVSGKYVKQVYNGRRINIALTGVDSRLGTGTKHADANHIISILIDSGRIEIISIPRDTPADAGFDDSTGQNKLTIVRANRGRKAYFGELCRISNLDKIHNYAELGFSQAMGIIEFLGYEKPHETLQILRSRSALGGDDFQRVYNQAQFIRQMLFKNFNRLNGMMGDILIGGGLVLVESDLTNSKIKDIIKELDKKKFGSSLDNITIRIKPSFPAKFKVYDFADNGTVTSLSNMVKKYYKRNNPDEANESAGDSYSDNVFNKLTKVLDKSVADTAKNPKRAINTLSVYFDQRAWLQILDIEKRKEVRNRFVDVLSYSYEKRKDTISAKKIIQIATQEEKLFNSKNNM